MSITSQELLRSFIDLLDAIGRKDPEDHHSPNQAVLTPVAVDNVDNTETSMMVPPLQQKIELLKKAVDVDSIYDEPEGDCGCGSPDDDEMTIMRRNAGINPIVMHIASDHEAE
jgi:hypothetical protein